MSQFEVLSKDSCAQAGWFCEGVVRKNSQACLLKTKEMIMPGIMSEGSGAGSAPRYARWRSPRSQRPGVSGGMRFPARFERWQRTTDRKADADFPRPAG